MEDLTKRVEALERKLSHPMPFEMQKIIEQVNFDSLNILKVKIPIYIVARTDKPIQGEMWITNIAGSPSVRKINAYINGTTYSATLT